MAKFKITIERTRKCIDKHLIVIEANSAEEVEEKIKDIDVASLSENDNFDAILVECRKMDDTGWKRTGKVVKFKEPKSNSSEKISSLDIDKALM